jgi:hypothetical protein
MHRCCATHVKRPVFLTGSNARTRDASSTSASYDTDDNSFSRIRVRSECRKRGSPTRDASPVRSHVSRTKVDLLRDLFPGFFLSSRLRLQFKDVRARARPSSLHRKGSRVSLSRPSLMVRKSASREAAYISRPANLKILKSTFPAARMMAWDDC